MPSLFQIGKIADSSSEAMKQPNLLFRSIPAISALLVVAQLAAGSLHGENILASLDGVTRSPDGLPLWGAKVVAHSLTNGAERSTLSDNAGAFVIEQLMPDRYRVTATRQGYADSRVVYVDVSTPTVTPTQPNPASEGFFKRLSQAYLKDWKGTSASSAADPAAGAPGPPPAAPAFRGYPAPVDGPPFPFSVWPYGGSVTIGQPWTQAGPLMTALWEGPHGEAWKRSGVQIYGWFNFGGNLSSSNQGGYSNFPTAYDERANTVEPDQEVLYIERQPDTVQQEHFDWGFRLSLLYGIDYRFTTARGIFSNQLLGKNQEYGFDPVMAYVDLYVPQVAKGMDIRIGRYISLPDIEAQLAPNNYTYSHSLTYSFDCYTQTGINTTTKLSNHWLVQVGLSPGCDVAPWVKNQAKLTLNSCLGFTWQDGQSNLYGCANSINDGDYAYNNLQAYYLTSYHKFNDHWHEATEGWYQYMKHVPNVNNPAAAPLISATALNGAGNGLGAVCTNASALTCFAPDWAVVNYIERQFSKHDYMSIRNEYMDDIAGQRTGVKNRYSEHLIGWGHWIGTTVLLRPELRFEHAYDRPIYNNGTKQSQLTFAGDVIFFF